jgi:Zn-dependent protease
MFGLDPVTMVIRFLALLPGLVGHEFSHGYSAYLMGDPTPKLQGRLTLNPLAHLTPIGTLMILFAPIGWAKPVQINPYNFRDSGKGLMISTAFGPISNIVQGTFWALVLRLVLAAFPHMQVHGNLFIAWLALTAYINFALAIFNLIPLGPLDGHAILRYFLPYRQAVAYHEFNVRYGMAVLIGLIALPFVLHVSVLGYVFVPADLYGQLVSGVPLYAVFFYAMGYGA